MKQVNISDRDLIIDGVGIVKPGEERDMPKGFHNANFKPVEIKTELPEKNKPNIINNNEQSSSR